MHIFARMTKVDEATRTVTGVIANEALDRSGEVFDYASSKPHFEKWSGDIAKSTEGKSVGNVRAMHGNIAAGLVKQMDMDDGTKSISVNAHIVDDNEWRKVQAGVYTGFSIGGKYARKWKGDDGLQRYTAEPCEVSLVDLPCNPDAQFSVIKADGSEELRKFETATADAEAPQDDVPADAVVAEVEPVDAVKADETAVLELAASDELAKAGARHSAKDKAAIEALAKHHAAAKKHLAAMDDHMASLNSAPPKPDEAAEKMAKSAYELHKIAAERDDLAKKLETVTGQYAELLTKAEAPKGAVRAVSKDADNNATLQKIDDSPVLKADGSPDHQATAIKLIKAAHSARLTH